MADPELDKKEATGEAPAPQVLKEETIYKGRIVTLKVETVRRADGQERKREVVAHPGAVVMVAVNAEGKIYLVRQYRQAAEKRLLELPAGTLEEGEAPIVTAGRELQEEIGFKAGKIVPLTGGRGGFYSAPGYATEYLSLFLATDLTEDRLQGDEDESAGQMAAETVTLDAALDLIKTGEIEDAKSIAGILLYNLRRADFGL